MNPPPTDPPAPIVLHEDDWAIALDKPPGWLVVPGRFHRGPVLRDWAAARFGPVWVVHRIDCETSGVVLFARSAETHRALCRAFEDRSVRKSYLALVIGVPEPPDGLIDLALHPARRGKMRPARPSDAGALPAITRYRTLERLGGCTSLEVVPATGRHHQIRVHLRACGWPIAGDPLYARGWPCPAVIDRARLWLHANTLEIAHPGQPDGLLKVIAEVPGDFERAVSILRDSLQSQD